MTLAITYPMDTEYYNSAFSFRPHNIPHYYGDHVRMLFLGAALVSFIVMPLWGNLLPFGTFAQVAAGLLLVLLAGLTHPRGKVVLLINAFFAGVSVFLLESMAITHYASESLELFLAREASAILLLVAFYFSVKTFRALQLGKIGKSERLGEFNGASS